MRTWFGTLVYIRVVPADDCRTKTQVRTFTFVLRDVDTPEDAVLKAKCQIPHGRLVKDGWEEGEHSVGVLVTDSRPGPARPPSLPAAFGCAVFVGMALGCFLVWASRIWS